MAGKGSIVLLILSVLNTFHIAADSNSDMLIDADLLPLLLQQGANPNSIGEKDRTVLLHACMAGDLNVDVFKSLVQAGADPDIRDEYGRTALWWARVGAIETILRKIEVRE